MEQISLSSPSPPLVPTLRNVSVKQTRRSVFFERRTIRCNDPSSELRIIACVQHPRDPSALISLIDWMNRTRRWYILVSTVQLIELAFRASTLLLRNISSRHNNYTGQLGTQSVDIATMFDSYAQKKCGVMINTTTFDTMHEDVIVATKIHHAALILLPFHLHQRIHGSPYWEITTDPSVRNINESIMRTSPCTVDDRECISLAGRMAGHPSIDICVVRFMWRHANTSNDLRDENEVRELQVDEECMHELTQKSGHVGMVRCINNVVNNAEDVLEVLKLIAEEGNDLLIVGKGHELAEAKLMSGVIEGAEFPELGRIGDLLASLIFHTTSSLIVIQAPKTTAAPIDSTVSTNKSRE